MWSDSRGVQPGDTVSLDSVVLRVPAFPLIKYWFPPQIRAALTGIAEAAHECRDPHFETVALVTLSASIISKWPNTLSYAMDIDHTRPHRRIQRFRLNRVLDAYLKRLDRTIGCLGTLSDVYRRAGVSNVLSGRYRIVCPHDARKPLPDVPDESQSLVVTSPPYFNAVDYPRAHRLSVCWMNGRAPADLTSRNNYIGLHQPADFDPDDWLRTHSDIRKLFPSNVTDAAAVTRKLTGFYADLEDVLKQVYRYLRPGGHCVFVIGDNVIKAQRVASHEVLVRLAEELGFAKRRVDSREIAGLRRRYPVGPFGFDGPLTHEFIVVLQKPLGKRKRNPDKDLFYGSTHEMPLFPGTGALSETGVGNIFNAPLRAAIPGSGFARRSNCAFCRRCTTSAPISSWCRQGSTRIRPTRSPTCVWWRPISCGRRRSSRTRPGGTATAVSCRFWKAATT